MSLLDRVQDLLTRHPGLSRSQAVHQVLAADPEAHRRWHLGIPDDLPAPAQAAAPELQDPGALLHQLALARVAAGQAETFQVALDGARKSYPALAAAYHQGRMIEGGTAPAAGPQLARFRLAFNQASGTALRGVQVFRTGEWNGRRYTPADLRAMLDAFHALDFRPALKIGHSDDQELAHGFVSALRIEDGGHTLVADFENVPAETVALIRQGRLVTVSSEIWFDLKRAGGTYPRVLRAVALLGSSPPGVAHLRPLAEALPTPVA